ncbi:hypothetical protein MASR2M70_02860 [Bacillota bacterium]
MKDLFNKTMGNHLPTLKQYVPVVAKVHGAHHPEFYEVRQLFDAIDKKAAEAGSDRPELSGEFAALREITKNYKVPEDTCETFAAVYSMLSDLDRAYNAEMESGSL